MVLPLDDLKGNGVGDICLLQLLDRVTKLDARERFKYWIRGTSSFALVLEGDEFGILRVSVEVAAKVAPIEPVPLCAGTANGVEASLLCLAKARNECARGTSDWCSKVDRADPCGFQPEF
jgi:hypothetical protein